MCVTRSFPVPCSTTLLSELRCTLTELPPFLQFYRFPECRTVRHPVNPVPEWKEIRMPEPVRSGIRRETQSGTGMLRYRTEMMNARIPMPAASASMSMPNYGNGELKRINDSCDKFSVSVWRSCAGFPIFVKNGDGGHNHDPSIRSNRGT